MGGNINKIFGIEPKRLNKSMYFNLIERIEYDLIKSGIKCYHLKAYESKISFGDSDFLIWDKNPLGLIKLWELYT